MAYVRYVLFPLVVGAVFFPPAVFAQAHGVPKDAPVVRGNPGVKDAPEASAKDEEGLYRDTPDIPPPSEVIFHHKKKEEALGVSSLTKKNV